ncbi:MAG: hypothetical protein GXP26_03540 [Planctomycetes bacterium]|nr:hypothetical protein [Planctomycetota bacterium]
MFITRPLTWLFIAATITVDLTLAVTWSYGTERYIVWGYLLGQIATLAIWAIRGRIHRLLRASCFVLATGMLVTILNPPSSFALACLFVYASAIFVVTLLTEAVRHLPDAGNIEQRKRWQFPLIEFFGWTIVVAVVSLGCRDMEFKEIFEITDVWLQLLALLTVPILLVLFTRNDLRDLRAIKSLIIVGAAIVAGWYFSYFDASFFIVTQTAYLVAWMTVLTLDNILAEANEVRKKHPDEAPKLFDPDSADQIVPDDTV